MSTKLGLFCLPLLSFTILSMLIDATMAQAPREVTEVNYKDIPRCVTIVGELGPLGRLVTIRGKWVDKPGTAKVSAPVFKVTDLDGTQLMQPAELIIIESVLDPLSSVVPAIDEEWEFRGYETGGFVGHSNQISEAIMKAYPMLQPVSPMPSGFLTKFCYITAKPLSTEKVHRPQSTSPPTKKPKGTGAPPF